MAGEMGVYTYDILAFWHENVTGQKHSIQLKSEKPFFSTDVHGL